MARLLEHEILALIARLHWAGTASAMVPPQYLEAVIVNGGA